MIIHDVEWDIDDATEDPAIMLTEEWQKYVRLSAERIPTYPQAILANPTPGEIRSASFNVRRLDTGMR